MRFLIGSVSVAIIMGESSRRKERKYELVVHRRVGALSELPIDSRVRVGSSTCEKRVLGRSEIERGSGRRCRYVESYI